MLNLAGLPPEIFDIVLDMALPNDSEVDRFFDPHDSEVERERLFDLSTISRQWHRALSGRIYSQWTFNGVRQSFMTLWRFLRTMCRNPNLASWVQTLRIANWGFFDHAYIPGQELELPSDELDLVKIAISDAGISHLESNILESLSKRDRRPLMALLLTRLPNLSNLYAVVPRSDPVLYAVLEQVITRQKNGTPSPVLGRLKECYRFQEYPVLPPHLKKRPDEDPAETDFLPLDDIWPMLLLQSLRKISLYDVDPAKASALLGSSAGASSAESLDLVISSSCQCANSDIQSLIRLSHNLKSFSLDLNSIGYPKSRIPGITNTGIWEGLSTHKPSLESFHYSYGVCRPAGCDRLDVLRNFTRLKHVSLEAQALLLLGDRDYKIYRAPFFLKDALPSGLESLTLLGEEFNGGTTVLMKLEELICPEFPSLKSIVLETDCSVPDYKYDPLHTALQRKFRENGIDFNIYMRKLRPGDFSQGCWVNTLRMRSNGWDRAQWFGDLPNRFRDLQELLLRPKHEIDLGRDR